MGQFTLYAIKSAICLTLLYLPYTLLLSRDTFHSLNRMLLLAICLLSLVLPLLNVPLVEAGAWQTLTDGASRALIEVEQPVVVVDTAATGTTVAVVAGADGVGWATLVVDIYIIGVVVCMVYQLWQLFRLHRALRRGVLWFGVEDGVQVYCHADRISPFSWMRSIAISEYDYRFCPSVMIHEREHIRLRHSADLMLVGVLQVLLWWNPCVWLLGISLREVHEYQADAAVLRHGVTARDYQMLLIRKAIGSSSYTFANGFNHSLLKKRFTMMMKKDSNRWRRTKVLYLLPVAAVQMAAFATPEFKAYPSVDNADKGTTIPVTVQAFAPENVEISQLDMPATSETTAVSAMPADSVPYDIVDHCEVLPQYPGGPEAMMHYLSSNVAYPADALEHGVQGVVYVTFVVRADGHLDDIKVGQARIDDGSQDSSLTTAERAARIGAAESLKAEALRVVKSMPDKWEPGTQGGKAVNVRFTIPITFRLS